MEIFGNSITALERSMDLRVDNQRIIAANLANADTPGYVAQRMDFAASMQNALAGKMDPPVVQASTGPAVAENGNNVDMEDELSQMTRNRVLYTVESQLLAAKFRQLGTVLSSNA
jgi:flagellar basal-body rod protein FlgB